MIVLPAVYDRLADVVAAVLEAYEPDGVVLWWRSWLAGDARKRERMEAAVVAAWSGRR